MSKHEHIRVAITLGDMNGIGPEVTLKALSNPKLLDFCTPVLYASPKALSFYKKQLGLHEMNFHFAKTAEQIHHRKLNLVVCWEEEVAIEPGKPSELAGKYALLSLERATADIKAGLVDVMVTAPLDKSTVNTNEVPFSGHTEYLSEADGNEALMTLVCDDLRVALVTGHIPLAKVSGVLSRDRIAKRIGMLVSSLQQDFGIAKPRIAILGLNPHAGDRGLLGKEEDELIAPVVAECVKNGTYAFGPYSADGFFGSDQFRKFDAVLAMYHDQGLIPFKFLGFEDGVNFSAGLTFIRTSPDHGTGYDIAGKNVAIESSMRNAIYLAIDLFRKRRQLTEAGEKPLQFTPLKRERFRMDF